MIEGEEMKSWIGPSLLEDLALAYAAAGQIPEALRVVERMKDPSSQVAALLGRGPFSMSWVECPAPPGVALVQARAGDKALARKTLERAAELVASMPGDAPGRARAVIALAGAQARLGEFAAARKTVEWIQPETGKAIALAALVRQLARAGRAQEALREIDRLPAGAAQVHILMHLGAGQAEAGDRKAARASFERAERLIGQEQDEGQRMGQAVNLATVRSGAGDYEGALQTAETYFPKYTLGHANIAHLQAKAGDFKGALKIAEKLKDSDWWKLNILQLTAEYQAQRGEAKAAREWIGRLDSPLARAYALLGAAEGSLPATTPPGKK
jgi:tetratricopeptide (TPR) repeat protein